QLLVDIGDAECLERAAHTADRDVEIVEGADCAGADGASLRRLRVDIVELLEARWILDVVKQRQGVSPLRRLGTGVSDKRTPLESGGGSGKQASVKQEAAAQAHGGPPVRTIGAGTFY